MGHFWKKVARPAALALAAWTLAPKVPVWAQAVTTPPAPVLSAAHDPLAFGPDIIPRGTMVEGRHGMVVSAQHLASAVGADILRRGGNAADAAAAVGYALSVVYPAAGSLGGGGFSVVWLPGKAARSHQAGQGHAVFVDFREKAPAAATATMFLDGLGKPRPGLSAHGWKAVAVPGTVAGMEALRQRWGRLSRAVVMEPAIRLAREGYVLEQGDVDLMGTNLPSFREDPYGRHIFLHEDGSTWKVGERFKQPALAASLALVARLGGDAFYKGPLAGAITQASQQGGGLLTMGDFARYHASVAAPLRCGYRGFTLHTAPPPSAGGVALCEMLGILEGYNMKALGPHTLPAVQVALEAMRHAYSDRRSIGDPAFTPSMKVVGQVLAQRYLSAVRQSLPLDHALDSRRLQVGRAAPLPLAAPLGPLAQEKHETTQYSVMDHDGMAVSTTFTLDGWFGAGVMGGGTGIWLNDEMDDFAMAPGVPNMFGVPGSAANAIAPGKVPLSSMAPTVVTRHGRAVLVFGSPGGSRIPTILLSVMSGLADYGFDLRQAVVWPRIHEQWMPPPVEVEPGALSPEVRQGLEKLGYVIVPHRPWGMVEAILTDAPHLVPQAGATPPRRFFGVADPRHPGGAAIGY
ncbi:gamma-glutamyltransferase [Formicincola oecophyllae]|uniref:Glutathione hydrolase proenzyme n=1 Tax=Formicincola oecophyllae TaxID=2558361 RepID=A0A4Y6U8V1_9PROT|nr:gamma-glutamyltransferase [Formicincola oecophyllae]QDH13634.1 gamma-glutamyltransferase [Formicincola oecophyllae]